MDRIAILDGVRTPFCKAGTAFSKISADDLGAIVTKEILARTGVDAAQIDEVIFGNVAQPSTAANIARVIALKAGLPQHIPAYTVHRNCASGMESMTSAADKINTGRAQMILAGGTESMSNIPLLFSDDMRQFFDRLSRAKTPIQKLQTLLSFRLRYLAPRIGLIEGLTDPTCGLIMGLTAENLARDFKISREAQDQFALASHQKAVKAQKDGLMKNEIIPVPIGPKYEKVQETDIGPREDQSLEALAKLKPYFDRKNGTVTVGNACPITDGAGAVILTSEKLAKSLNIKPLGYIKDYAYAGLDPTRMGLGPVFATAKVLEQSKLSVKDIDLIEMNEAFSVQILANLQAFASTQFAKEKLNRNAAVGEINPDIVNVNGGAVALGHPVGTSGTRIIVTLLKEMERRNLKTGLATLCIGGGQGGAVIVERDA